MMRSFLPDRWTSPWVVAGILCVALAVAAVIFPGTLTQAPGSAELLEHLDGSVDHRRHTFDPVKSDLYVRASRALKDGEAQGAEALYREIVAKYPKESESYAALGACLTFENRYKEARTEYLRALELNSQSVSAHYGLGCVAYEENRNIEAKKYLEQALALDPNDARSHRVLGLVDEQLGDVPQAVANYQRAMALDPVIGGDSIVRQRLEALKQ